MNPARRISRTGLALALAATGAAPAAAQQHAPRADIVETAAAAGSFNTLAAALEAANLVETLQGDGPFSVFAPTDEAFAALPAGTLERLLLPPRNVFLDHGAVVLDLCGLCCSSPGLGGSCR